MWCFPVHRPQLSGKKVYTYTMHLLCTVWNYICCSLKTSCWRQRLLWVTSSCVTLASRGPLRHKRMSEILLAHRITWVRDHVETISVINSSNTSSPSPNYKSHMFGVLYNSINYINVHKRRCVWGNFTKVTLGNICVTCCLVLKHEHSITPW